MAVKKIGMRPSFDDLEDTHREPPNTEMVDGGVDTKAQDVEYEGTPKAQAIFEFALSKKVVIIPCSPNKTSSLISFQNNASARKDSIFTWFSTMTDNRMPGLLCGSSNNIIAIDCDVKNGNGIQEFQELCSVYDDSPSPVYQDTPSGGRHYFYQYDSRVTSNIVGVKISGKKSNIDIRTDGGYVLIDPFKHTYQMVGDLNERPVMPDWLASLLEVKPIDSSAINTDDALKAALEEIERAEPSTRNVTLNKIAFWMGRHISTVPERENEVKKALVSAGVEIGLDSGECHRTVNSGLFNGIKKGPFENEMETPRFLKKIEGFTESKELENLEYDDILKALPPPPFDALSERLQYIVTSVAKGKCVPPEMVMGMLFALGSACIGRARGLMVQKSSGWTEFANLYFLIIAETGVGKSHTFDFIFKHLFHMEAKEKARWKIAQKKYEEDVILWKKKKNNEDPAPKKPVNTQYLLDDATIEAAIERLEDNKRGLFWSVDEFSGFFQGLDRYSKNGSGEGKRKLLSAYDSKGISSSRKSKDGLSNEIYLPKATIGLYGNIQPNLVPMLFTYNDVVQGWPQRFVYIRAQVKAPMILPLPDIDEEVPYFLRRITERLIGLTMPIDEIGEETTEYITVEPEIFDIYVHFSNAMSRGTFQTDSEGYAAKMRRMTLRMALILHLMEWAVSDEQDYERKLSHSSMSSAVQISNWLMAHTERVKMLLPDGTNKKVTPEIATGERLFANMIINKTSEIMALEGVIDNDTWKEWTDEANISLSAQASTPLLKSLGIEFGRNRTQRYKVITPKVIEKCRKMSAVMSTILSPDNEDA